MKKLLLAIVVIAGLAGAGVYLMPGGDTATVTKTAIDPVPAAAPDPEIPVVVPPRPVMEKPVKPKPKAYRFGPAETVLANKLELELGRKAEYNVRLDRSVKPWRLVCGAPVEIGGKAFDYTSSKRKADYEEGYLENQFCALFKDRTQDQELVAFDLGSTDNYITGWSEKLDLPSALID